MTDDMKDTADYEASEEKAIADGKAAFKRAEWLADRAFEKFEGFFAELRDCPVSPDHYEVFLVDGNGTKLFLSAWSDDYRQGPIDGIAMNANDMATLIHTFPSSINIYMACQTWVEENKMGEIMNGFVDGLEKIRVPHAPWNINKGKIETASLDEMISLGIPNKGVDFGIVMTGYIAKDKVPNLDPKPGQPIVGVSSTGLHSNGYTGARHVLISPEQAESLESNPEWRKQYRGRFSLHDRPDILEGKTVLEAMQIPTALYLVEAAMMGQKFDDRDIYGVNITGNGLHNFNRAGQGVSFEITDPFDPHPIHMLLVQESGWDVEKSYRKQNMGMGFAYVFPDLETAEEAVNLINERGENTAKIAGEVGNLKKSEDEMRTTLHKHYEGNEPVDFVGY
ncbi:hypothetical protein GF345_00745 [Candidatus Woesearchaeota archaeon]|nr:hypothetical protein [Candidatus Woesearchaeota archaeon]